MSFDSDFDVATALIYINNSYANDGLVDFDSFDLMDMVILGNDRAENESNFIRNGPANLSDYANASNGLPVASATSITSEPPYASVGDKRKGKKGSSSSSALLTSASDKADANIVASKAIKVTNTVCQGEKEKEANGKLDSLLKTSATTAGGVKNSKSDMQSRSDISGLTSKSNSSNVFLPSPINVIEKTLQERAEPDYMAHGPKILTYYNEGNITKLIAYLKKHMHPACTLAAKNKVGERYVDGLPMPNPKVWLVEITTFWRNLLSQCPNGLFAIKAIVKPDPDAQDRKRNTKTIIYQFVFEGTIIIPDESDPQKLRSLKCDFSTPGNYALRINSDGMITQSNFYYKNSPSFTALSPAEAEFYCSNH